MGTAKVAKIIIGYRTRLVAGADKNLPEFKAPSNWKDEAKIKADIAEKREAFIASAKSMPYTGTFDEVVLIDRKNDKLHQWKHPTAEESKPPVAVRVRNYLTKMYPNAWVDDTHGHKSPEVILVGFDMRTFIKILGLECSLPAIDKNCPLGLWYTNTDHRDIEEAIMPKDFKGLTLPYVLKQRRPTDPTQAKHWDGLIEGWPGPGILPERDALIAVELATQLGFLEV